MRAQRPEGAVRVPGVLARAWRAEDPQYVVAMISFHVLP